MTLSPFWNASLDVVCLDCWGNRCRLFVSGSREVFVECTMGLGGGFDEIRVTILNEFYNEEIRAIFENSCAYFLG